MQTPCAGLPIHALHVRLAPLYIAAAAWWAWLSCADAVTAPGRSIVCPLSCRDVLL